MAAPPKVGASFSPEQIKHLGDAFDRAVCEASGEGTPYATIPTLELRRQLAGLILAEARSGPINPSRLVSRALESLKAMTIGHGMIERLWSEQEIKHVKAIRRSTS